MGSLQRSLPLFGGNFQGQGCVHVLRAFLLLVQTCALGSGRLNIPKSREKSEFFQNLEVKVVSMLLLKLDPEFGAKPGAVASLLVPGAWAGRAWLGQLVALLGTAAPLLPSVIFKLDLETKSGNG